MSKEDLSIFPLEDLYELKESALNTYKLIKRQIAGIPNAEIPTLKQIELDDIETKIKLYENEINSRKGLKKEDVQVQEGETENWKSKIRAYIASNRTKKAIEELITLSKGNSYINNQVLLLSNRLETIQYNERHILRTHEEILIENAKINRAILELINEWH